VINVNLLLLEQSDFSDDNLKHAVVKGRRLEHARSVFRITVGEKLKTGLLNGKMGEGTVMSLDNEKLELEVELSADPPPPAPVFLIIALPRPKSLKKTIETAASMGVKKIVIIESWRVEKSYWASPVLGPETLREHLVLGLEQARDTILPVIEFRRRFKPFIEDELPQLVQGTTPFVAHPYDAAECPYHTHGPFTLALGPEGGFIPYEINKFRECGFNVVTIGPRILRVESALPAFLGRLL
jgi:16S rRNA (uracil1498-N3)-methyltransferase